MKLLFWLSLALLAGPGGESVWAHSFYSAHCCQDGRDCQPIPTRSVQITAKGYLVSLHPGEHVALGGEAATRIYLVPFADAKESPDGGYHACILPYDIEKMRCFYAPPLGS